MKRVLWIPAALDEEVKVIDLDESKWRSYEGFREGNPYMIGQELHRQINEPFSEEIIWQERVRTPFKDVFLFVDDTGRLKQLPKNSRAEMFYPGGPIAGNAYLCVLEQYMEEIEPGYAEPNIRVRDMPDGLIRRFLRNMEPQGEVY